MNHAAFRSFIVLCANAVLATATASWFLQPVKADSSYCAVWFLHGNPPRLTMFPPDGPAVIVALPAGLPSYSRAIGFSLDGRAMYNQKIEPFSRSNGIYKVEFQPARERVVPGSVGTGEVTCLSESRSSEKIIFAGWSWSHENGGVFEIDPITATRQLLPMGSASICGGSGGILSPDGGHAVKVVGKGRGLLDMKTGVVRALKGTNQDTRCSWSPDSKRVACVQEGKVSLLDADALSHPRNLGSAGQIPVEWSPDSKYLLLRSSPLSCAFTPYGESLMILDVKTGKRKLVASSNCKITSGDFGWLDCNIR